MAYLDPYLLQTFRGRIANPANWGCVYQTLRSYRFEDLQDPEGANAMVSQLSGQLGVPLTYEQRANAVQWLMEQRINPANPLHQARMWQIVNGD